MKTTDLEGVALDWATRIIFNPAPEWGEWKPSSNWAQGGVIIELEKISLSAHKNHWMASIWMDRDAPPPYTPAHRSYRLRKNICAVGKTPLIAAMRCYVSSKMGDEIIIPEHLTKEEA